MYDSSYFLFKPNALNNAIQFFRANFKGEVLYAVKTNPEDHIISALYNSGISNFDVASLGEIKHLRQLAPKATLYFMHPVKSRFAIREAYYDYDIKYFSLDSEEELEKILNETNYATDLNLFVRIAIPNNYAEHSLSEKFGINLHEAHTLLRKVRPHAQKLGICFHVGSQCMHPDAYRIGIRMASKVIKDANVPVEYFNVGGGFPSIYPGMMPPPLTEYFDAIHEEFTGMNINSEMKLLSEPGRALVAESSSLIVRVELRKKNNLYINDGTYGSLFDAGTPQFIFPVRLLGNSNPASTDLLPFSFYGPTCDSLDYMKGPFYLPNDIKEGDYIEIGQMGAYAKTMSTSFNGFSQKKEYSISHEAPLMTMYQGTEFYEKPLEIIAA